MGACDVSQNFPLSDFHWDVLKSLFHFGDARSDSGIPCFLALSLIENMPCQTRLYFHTVPSIPHKVGPKECMSPPQIDDPYLS